MNKNECIYCYDYDGDYRYKCDTYTNNYCESSIKIVNKPSFFLMDGTNLKLIANITDCGVLTHTNWTSSINSDSLIIHNQGRSLYVDASNLKMPKRHFFNVQLYNHDKSKKLDEDRVEIDFVTTSINGGKISSFYFNDTIIFSIDVFDKIVKPRLNGTVNYVWTCPGWVPFDSCNQRSNKPVITVNGSQILQDYFMSDILYDVSVKVLVDKLEYIKMVGFCVVYSQKSINSYFDFKIANMTQIGYNLPMKHEIQFINQVEREALKNDLLIKWSVDKVDVVLMNGDSLPMFLFPSLISDTEYTITCELTYRKNTKVETKITKSEKIIIYAPKYLLDLIVEPDKGIFSSKFKLTAKIKNKIEADTENYVKRYQYFYLNPSGDYVLIENKDDMGDTYRPRIIPPTESIKVRTYYNSSSYNEEYLTVSITNDINFDFFSSIQSIFEDDIEDALLQLEAYSLNFRKPFEYPNIKDIPAIAKLFIQKLTAVLNVSKKSQALSDLLNNNLNKVGNILEGFITQMSSIEAVSDFINIFVFILDFVKKYNNYKILTDVSCHNFVRAYDNLIELFPKDAQLFSQELGIFDSAHKLIAYTMLFVELGIEKHYNLKNIAIIGTRINTLYLKNNITYEFQQRVNDYSISDESRDEIYRSVQEDEEQIQERRNLQDDEESADVPKTSVVVSSVFLNEKILDGTLQIFYFRNLNYETNVEYLKATKKLALTQDLLQVKMLNITKYVIIEEIKKANNVTSSSTESSSKTTQNITYTIERKETPVTEYNFIEFNNETFVTINFTMPDSFNRDILNKTTCILVDEEFEMGDDEEAVCNTWFDFTNKIIQCECDKTGMYTVIYNPLFKYLRKRIQFPQLNDSINQPWGYGTLIILIGGIFMCIFWAYNEDKKQLNQIKDASAKSAYYQEYRQKLNKDNLNIKTVTFTKLYCDILKFSNDLYSFKHYKDFYFLRAHRMLVFLVRIYIVIIFGFYKQVNKVDLDIQKQIDERNISIKDKRSNIYMWEGDWGKEIGTSLYYALPIGLVMVLFPKLSEWLFRYDESQLRFEENNNMVDNISSLFYKKLYSKCKKEEGDNFEKIKMNIEENQNALVPSNSQKVDITIEELKMKIDKRKYKAFINYHRMIGTFLFGVRFQLYKNEKRDNLPEDLAPLYNQKIQGQIEKFENRAYQTKRKFIKEVESSQEAEIDRNQIFKDKRRLLENIEIIKQGREFNQEGLFTKCK